MHRPNSPDPVGGDLHPDAHADRPLRIGIGGPVGSGKTALIAALCKTMSKQHSLAVVTNDIYTTEDADRLRRDAVLTDDRIVAVRTGCCPHTAVRDDITANLDAVEGLEHAHPDLDLILLESGGDNLTLTWSQALVDHEVFVIDVSAGDDIPRKGGPGITRSDLLVINKTDLAPYVHVDLDGMARDADIARNGATTIFASITEDPDAGAVSTWVEEHLTIRTPAPN